MLSSRKLRVALLVSMSLLPAGMAQVGDPPSMPGEETQVVKTSVSFSETNKIFSRFQIKSNQEHSSIEFERAFVPKGCAKFLRVSLIEADPNKNRDFAAILIERNDIQKGETTLSSEEACLNQSVATCTVTSCDRINDIPGISEIESKRLKFGGDIKFYDKSMDDLLYAPMAFDLHGLSDSEGKAVHLHSQDTLDAIAEELRKHDDDEAFVELCESAMEGNLSDIEALARELGEDHDLIAEARAIHQQKLNAEKEKQVADLLSEIQLADSPEKLDSVIAKVKAIAAKEKKKNPEFAKGLANLLGISAVAKAKEFDSSDSNDIRAAGHTSLIGAYMAAREIDSSNVTFRLGAIDSKLARGKFAATSGDRKYYTPALQRDLGETYQALINWSNASRDTEVLRRAQEFSELMAARPFQVPLINAMNGQILFGYDGQPMYAPTPGYSNKFDAVFTSSLVNNAMTLRGTTSANAQSNAQGLPTIPSIPNSNF